MEAFPGRDYSIARQNWIARCLVGDLFNSWHDSLWVIWLKGESRAIKIPALLERRFVLDLRRTQPVRCRNFYSDQISAYGLLKVAR